MKNYKSDGTRLTLTAPKNLSSGELVVIGAKVVAAMGDVLNGNPFTALLYGEVEGKLRAGDVPTELQAMYLDDVGELTVSPDDGGAPAVDYTLAGYCSEVGTGKIVLD